MSESNTSKMSRCVYSIKKYLLFDSSDAIDFSIVRVFVNDIVTDFVVYNHLYNFHWPFVG